jgi:hypothetical protein
VVQEVSSLPQGKAILLVLVLESRLSTRKSQNPGSGESTLYQGNLESQLSTRKSQTCDQSPIFYLENQIMIPESQIFYLKNSESIWKSDPS